MLDSRVCSTPPPIEKVTPLLQHTPQLMHPPPTPKASMGPPDQHFVFVLIQQNLDFKWVQS